jgi:hypothetical protein
MKNNNKGFTIVELITVIGMGVSLIAVIALVYVAAHFIAKIW